MNIKRSDTRSFAKSLVIRLPHGFGAIDSQILKVDANDKNPHWYEGVDKWSEEWCCIINKRNISIGIYGPIDPVSGVSLVSGIYVVMFRGGPLFYHEVQRTNNIEILSIDDQTI